jgi:hypothetical protein
MWLMFVFDTVVGGTCDIIAAGRVSCHCRVQLFLFLNFLSGGELCCRRVVRSVGHGIDMMSRNVVALAGPSPLIRSFLDPVLSILSLDGRLSAVG